MLFTQQQLEEAYRQMEKDRKREAVMAERAAKKLESLGVPHVHCRKKGDNGWNDASWHSYFTPYPDVYELFTEMCQYDDWQGTYRALGKVCTMKPWNGVRGGQPKMSGSFDLSNDPDFANEHQKIYRVTVDYYDSHVGGY